MRVNQLYIICIRKHDALSIGEEIPRFEQPQFEEEARALALRSLILEKCDTVEIIQCSPFMFKSADPKVPTDNNPYQIGRAKLSRGGRPSDRPTIGVYVIAEGSTEGIGSLKPNELGPLLQGYGIKKLDKLHLISCNIGSDFPTEQLPDSWKVEGLQSEGEEISDNDFHNYVARACGILGVMRMGNGENGKLLVAGWKTYVTVAFPGRDSQSALGKKTTEKEKWETLGWDAEMTADTWVPPHDQKKVVKKMLSGGRYVTNTARKKVPARTLGKKNKPKVFYEWSMERGLRLADWSEWKDNV
jgi:hypothetical protein